MRFLFIFLRFFTFGRSKSNSRDGRSRHRQTNQSFRVCNVNLATLKVATNNVIVFTYFDHALITSFGAQRFGLKIFRPTVSLFSDPRKRNASPDTRETSVASVTFVGRN